MKLFKKMNIDNFIKNYFVRKNIIISLLLLVIVVSFQYIICKNNTQIKKKDFSKAAEACQIEYTTKDKNKLDISKASSWSQKNKFYTELSIKITNMDKKPLDNWDINISFPKKNTFDVVNSWNGYYSKNSNILSIKPKDYNTTIMPSKTETITFIVSSKNDIEIEQLSLSLKNTKYN